MLRENTQYAENRNAPKIGGLRPTYYIVIGLQYNDSCVGVYMHLGRYCTSAAYIKNNRREQSVTTWPRSVRVPRVM